MERDTEIFDIIEREYHSADAYSDIIAEYRAKFRGNSLKSMKELRDSLKDEMIKAADALDFERAAVLRDEMADISKKIELKEKIK